MQNVSTNAWNEFNDALNMFTDAWNVFPDLWNVSTDAWNVFSDMWNMFTEAWKAQNLLDGVWKYVSRNFGHVSCQTWILLPLGGLAQELLFGQLQQVEVLPVEYSCVSY